MKLNILAALLFFLGLHWFFLPVETSALSPMHVQARSAMLVDLTDGHVLYEQDADTPIPPASLTKVLTLYLVHEAIEEGRLNPEDMVTVSRRAASRGGSRMGLRAGEKVPVTELIKGMAVASGNDACVAIAEYLCGSVEQFVGLMNRKAAELGMRRTVFQTADGLPADGQFTTARDMAKLAAAYLRRFPYALGVHSMQSYTYGRSTHRNANRLLGTCPGVDGLKTGFVCASGYNFIATANRGDHRLVAVVLGARSPGGAGGGNGQTDQPGLCVLEYRNASPLCGGEGLAGPNEPRETQTRRPTEGFIEETGGKNSQAGRCACRSKARLRFLQSRGKRRRPGGRRKNR